MILKDLKMLNEHYESIKQQDSSSSDKDEPSCNKSKKHPTKKKDLTESFECPLFSAVFEQCILENFGKSPISGPYEHDKRVWALRRLSNGEISKIEKEAQYYVTWKRPEKHNNKTEQPLKGESVIPWLDFEDFKDLEIKSIRRPSKEDDMVEPEDAF